MGPTAAFRTAGHEHLQGWLIPLVLLMACGDGPSLVKVNTAPSIVITSHVDGDTLSSPGEIEFRADATDPESDPSDLTVRWSVDGAEVCADAEVDDNDRTVCVADLAQGTHVVSVTVFDPDQESATAQVSIDVLQPNRPPSCSISVPIDGTELRLGEPLTVVGVAGDADTSPDTLIASLSSDVDGAIDTVTPTSTGEVIFNVPALSGAVHLLTMRVEDPDGERCTDTTTVIIGQPPEITLTSPADAEVVDVGVPTVLVATTIDPDNTPPDLEVRWESDLDGILGTSTPDATGSATFTTQDLSRGVHLWSATVTDPDALSASDERTLVVNGPPDPPGVSISPAAPGPGAALTASISSDSVDLEGDPVTYTWTWTRDGNPAGTGATVPAGQVRRGEIWEAFATPNDGRIDGDPGSAAVSVGNARPEVTSVTLSPTDARTGERLFATAEGEDADGDTLTWTYEWRVDGATVSSGSAARFAGASRGESVTVVATAMDALTASVPVESAPVIIGNGAPSITGATLRPTSPRWSDVVTCEAQGYTDPEGDPAENTFQWSVDGVLDPTLTTNEIPAQRFTRGTQVQCTITPSDGVDPGDPVSSQVITYGNSPPEVTLATLQPDPPSVLDTLSFAALQTDDPDGDTVSTAISWRVGARSVGDGPTLVLSQLQRGDRVSADIVPSDGIDSGTTTTVEIDIGNAAPFDVVVNLSPANPSTSDTLRASTTGSDPDGDAITPISHEWFVNGQPQGGVAGGSLPPSFFGSGDEIRVRVTVSDGNGGTAMGESVPLVVGNTGPTAPEPRILPPVSDGTLDLQCTVHTPSVDSDGDPLSYTMAWELEGMPYNGATSTTVWPGDTIAAADLVPGRWTCIAVADDGAVPSAPGEDDARVIPPVPDTLISAGTNHFCAVVGGDPLCWGAFGPHLGQGHTDDIGEDPGELANTPTLPLGSRTLQIDAGPANTCALLANGTVKCWGYGGFGLPGQGDPQDQGDMPGEIAVLPAVPLGNIDVVQLAAHGHACVRTREGRVKCWGDNTSGQLGLGDEDHRGDEMGEMGGSLPFVDLGDDRAAIDIAVGDQISCALLDDNSVKCWGSHNFGALGLGASGSDRGDDVDEMGDALPAVDVGPGELTDIMLGDRSPCVQFDDGRVKCWGANTRGELGLGDTDARGDDNGEMGTALPTLDVGTGRSVALLSQGPQLHCALLDDDSLKCWGRGRRGALGSGNTEDLGDEPDEIGEDLPTLPWRGQEIVALASASESTCAVLACGDVRCWGGNTSGELGLGDQRNRGDDPWELGDALPLADLGDRRTASAASPSACARYGRTLTVDGDASDWLADEVFPTSAGAGADLMVSWDDDWIYLGTRHPDVATGTDEHWFIAYLGNGTDRAAVVSQPGFLDGVPHNSQRPMLAVEAQTMVRTKATLSYDDLAVANYPAGIPTWEGVGALSSGTSGGQIARGGDVVEMRLSREALGLHQILYLQTQWLFEGSGNESSYAACPIDMFPDGSFDPDYGTFLRFELDHPEGPGAAGVEVARP